MPLFPDPRAAQADSPLRVDAGGLRRRLDPSSLPFETTAEVEPLSALVGQPRVTDAIAFGVEMDAFGYNLFLAGAPGSGRAETRPTSWARRRGRRSTRPACASWSSSTGRPSPGSRCA